MEKKKHDAEFKWEAIILVEEGGQKEAAVSKKLDITDKTLYRWLSEYLKDRNSAFSGKDKQMTQILVIDALKQAVGRTNAREE